MTREIFLRIATGALLQTAGRSPEEQAEAIAARMDIVVEALGGGLAPPAKPAGTLPLTETAENMMQGPFPAPNPAAVSAVDKEVASLYVTHEQVFGGFYCQNCSRAMVEKQGDVCGECRTILENPQIIPATRIPDSDERAKLKQRDPEPVRSLRAPAGRMKVEDLSRLIQERTPERLPLDVPMGDETTRRIVFVRNVISMHAHDSVRLIYSPPNALPSVRESVEVQVVLHIDDVPLDLPAILKSLTEQAIASLRPGASPREVPVRPFSGAVQSGARYVDESGRDAGSADADLASLGQTQSVFISAG